MSPVSRFFCPPDLILYFPGATLHVFEGPATGAQGSYTSQLEAIALAWCTCSSGVLHGGSRAWAERTLI